MKTVTKQEPFNAFERGGQLILALNTEKILSETEPARQVNAQLEELDYRELYEAYSTKGRKSAADAKVMFQIICYGLCRVFALTETSKKLAGIDGTKLKSRAGRYTFVWQGAVEKHLQKVKEAVLRATGLTEKQKLKTHLEIQANGISFVCGRGKRKSTEQREYECLNKLLER